jgi:DNA-binding ferritin-like protein
MSVAEMKKAIAEKLEKLDETQLKELDIFINKINILPANEWNLSEHVKNIVNEREEVLQTWQNDKCSAGIGYS